MRNPWVELEMADEHECCRCECVGCGQYRWVQMDCPSQKLADEFGSLGTLRTMFVFGWQPWRWVDVCRHLLCKIRLKSIHSLLESGVIGCLVLVLPRSAKVYNNILSKSCQKLILLFQCVCCQSKQNFLLFCLLMWQWWPTLDQLPFWAIPCAEKKPIRWRKGLLQGFAKCTKFSTKTWGCFCLCNCCHLPE